MAYLDNVYAVVQIAPTGIPTYVRLSQNENGRVLNFAVSGDALPAGSTVALTGTKPDGAVYSASGTLADNVATFNEDEQLTAVAGEWDAKVEVTNSGNLIATGRIKFVIDADPSGGNIPSDSQLDGYIAEMLSLLDAGKAEAYGSPLVASTVAGMIDQSRVYVYTGSETGYTAGNWYYWNGSAWTSGGVYNAVAVSTDTTLSIAGKAADAKATGDKIDELKDDFTQIVTEHISSNRLDMSAMTANTYINTDGSSTSSDNFSVTDYIPVTAGETIYFWAKRTDDLYYNFDARFLCAYDSGKNAVSASGATWVAGSYTVPSGIAFVRLSISNTYLSTYSNFYVGSLPLDDYEQYEPYGTTYILINQPQVDENTAKLDSVTKSSSNLLNLDTITANTYIAPDGTESSIASLSVTDYIPVSEGDVIYGWNKSDGLYGAMAFVRLCAYDSSKNAVSASGLSVETTPPYTVPNGIAFVRISLRNTAIALQDVYVGKNAVGVDYEPYGTVLDIKKEDSTYTISNGDSILEAVKYCYSNGIKNLIVEAGTYDIIAEYEDHYGSTYFDDYIDYNQGDRFDAGIWLQNINLKFSAGAKVVCKYIGNNANVPLYFSAFATGNNVTLDGLNIDAENLRYAIHADFNTGGNETFFKVLNCDLKHYKNATSMQAIGAGLGRHVYWLIENTIFRSSGGNHIVCRIHNNVNSDALSKVIVKDCYIDGDGYFKFEPYSTSTDVTIVQVCGCSYKTVPIVEKITQESKDNMIMVGWNNEVRS